MPASHTHDCPECGGYFPCEFDDCSESDLCLECRYRKLESELHGVLHVIQRYQPAGSPIPGDCTTLTEWILDNLRSRLERAEKTLKEIERSIAYHEAPEKARRYFEGNHEQKQS